MGLQCVTSFLTALSVNVHFVCVALSVFWLEVGWPVDSVRHHGGEFTIDWHHFVGMVCTSFTGLYQRRPCRFVSHPRIVVLHAVSAAQRKQRQGLYSCLLLFGARFTSMFPSQGLLMHGLMSSRAPYYCSLDERQQGYQQWAPSHATARALRVVTCVLGVGCLGMLAAYPRSPASYHGDHVDTYALQQRTHWKAVPRNSPSNPCLPLCWRAALRVLRCGSTHCVAVGGPAQLCKHATV